MKHRIITISRQFGSGGRTIGKLTAEKLGLPCYDQEFIDQLVVAKSHFSAEQVQELGEYASSNWVNAFLGRTGGLTEQDQLWVLQRTIVQDLAQQGPCVIVGRCADYILRDSADCLRVFIHADLETRAQRIVSVYGETDTAPMDRLRQKDKRRAMYYQYYTDLTWGEMLNYHLTLDSGVLGIERCAAFLAASY